jgi:hypothetical protein
VQMSDIPFGVTDWKQIEPVEHAGLKDGRQFTLRPGMSYQVADQAEAHRSHTAVGAKLFIVD